MTAALLVSAPREKLLLAIADPNIAFVLLVVGVIGIYMEFSAPGWIAPGVLGAVLSLLGLHALSAFPIDWRGAVLMLLGMLFFIFEAKFATHGTLTIAGALALTFGAVMLIPSDIPELRIRWSTAVGVTLPFALISSFLFTLAVRARRNKAVNGPGGMLGLSATTVSELNPSGMVLVRGEYWNARTATRVAASAPVRITGIDGLTLQVEPLRQKEA